MQFLYKPLLNLPKNVEKRTQNAKNTKNTESLTLTLQKICFICFDESPLKMMKNAFYFILTALFFLKIFKLLFGLFGHVEKTA